MEDWEDREKNLTVFDMKNVEKSHKHGKCSIMIITIILYYTSTWSVQKVSRMLNFRGLRVFDFRFLWGYVGTHIPQLCRQVRPF